MKIKDLVAVLKNKDQELEVEFIVIGKDTRVIAMNLTSETCDQEKLFKAFKKPKKASGK